MEQSTVSTIYESACDKRLSEYTEQYKSLLNNYSLPTQSEDLMALLQAKQYLSDKMYEISNISISECNFNIRDDMEKYLDEKRGEVERDKEYIEDMYMRDMRNKQKIHEQDLLMADHDAQESIRGLKELKDKLDTYKDTLRSVFIRYNITPDNVEISAEIKEDMEELLQNSITVCEEFNKTTHNKLLDKLKVDPEEVEEKQGWIYIACCFAAVLFLSPVMLGYYMYTAVKGTKDIYSKIEALKIANALMYYGDFDKFIDKDAFKVDDIDTSDIDSSKEEQLSELEDIDAIDSEINNYIAQHANELAEKMYDATHSIQMLQQENLRNIVNMLEEITAAIDKIKAETHDLGEYINPSVVMDFHYIVSRYAEGIPCRSEISEKNLMFSAVDRDSMLSYMKLLFCNAILNVKEKHLYVTIVDPITLGSSFSEFFDTETQDYINVYTEDPNKILDRIKKEIADRVKKINTKPLQEFNTYCEKVGKVPLDYKLYIFLCEDKFTEENPVFKQLAEYSYQYGIMMWALTNAQIPNTTFFPKPLYGDGTPIEYDFALGAKCWNFYLEAFRHSKDRGVPYFAGYANKHIPRDKWWTYSTKKGIELHIGLLNGDPDRADPIVLGDNLVHGEMIGTTGSGKSVTLNEIIANLVTMYSPDELQLVMVDFKNVEFAFYSDVETHSYSRLPHAKVLSGTKDGEYALSLFDYLCAEMDRRQAIFTEHGVKKLEEYRDKFPDAPPMPRILVIIDEFQVMFTEVDPKIVNKIQDRIRSLAKLARFCGCHMLFCSQSMEGTMTKDVQDQFTLRIALFCMADVATKILGDDAPSKMKTKHGYCYTNENGGSTKDRNKFWRIPFADTPDLDKILGELNQMWGKKSTTEFYDDKRMHYTKDFDAWYEKYPDAFSDPHVMIIGEQTSYNTNKAPINFFFEPDDGENLIIFGKRREDIMNLNLTLVKNIQKSSDAQMFIHCADKDVYDALGVDLLEDPQIAEMGRANYPIEDLLDIWGQMIDARKDIPKTDLTPFYIFCIDYEKQRGYGRNASTVLTNRFERLMQEGPEVDIHFIVTIRSKGELMSANFKFFNHKIVAWTDDGNTAYQIAETDKPTKFPTALDEGIFAIYKNGAEATKFKIYQNKFAREIVDKTIYIA